MKISLLLCISFILALPAPLLHAAEAAKPSGQATILQDILILNSYHPGYTWSDDEQAGIIDVFRAKDKTFIPVIEYLDLQRLPAGKHLAELKKLFRIKYQKKKFSLLIAMDNPALEFAIDNQKELFRNVPIVFCGINNYTPSLLKGHTNVTGIVEAIDLPKTIEVMLRLHPDTREILVIHDHTDTGLEGRKEVETLAPRFVAQVRFRFLDRLSIDEVLKKLESLPNNSLVLLRAFNTDKTGHTFGLIETTRLFTKHSPVPVYAAHEQRLGLGIVGGKLLSARIHGADAARIALRVLTAEKASATPVVFKSDSQFMFDYKVMSRFGIPLSALPEASTVINKPVSFYAVHRVLIQTALSVIVFMAVVIALLTINIIQRRQSSNALRASETKYRNLIDHAWDAIFITDNTGNMLLVNKQACQMLGYTEEELIRLNVADTYPVEERAIAAQRIATVQLGDHLRYERSMVRKDGTIFPVEVAIGMLPNGMIQGIVRNITERKRAEETLRLTEENFRHSLDHSPLGVRIVTIEGETIYANRAILDFYGYDRFEELRTTPLKERYTPESYAEFQIRKEKRKRGDYSLSEYEISIIRKDGEVHHLQVFRKEILWSGERQFQVTYNDITDRKKAEEALRESEERFRNLSIVDDLTQLYNSRHFYHQLKMEIDRANRYEQPLTLMLLDLDDFKKFNDTYGHIEGDQVLLQLGQVIKRCLRQTDSAYRYGGEEFTILLPMTTVSEGVVTAERIRAELKKEHFSPTPGQDVHVTVSIGIAQYKPQEDIKTFVHRVDQLMYQGKKNGKDEICSEL